MNFNSKIIMKKFFISILFLSLNTQAQSIKFKDENLKKALIELSLDKNKNSQIEIKEVEHLKDIDISDKKIRSIDDLINFKNLKVINANNNLISDITPLYGNEKLEEIYIGDNQLGPILILKDMPNLKGVYAFRNNLKEIKFLSSFPNLKSLYLQENPITSLNIENLINLESLQLFECFDLKEIKLNKKTKIKQFFIIDMKVKNIVSNDEFTNIVQLEKIEDARNISENENFKIAPVIKVK